MEVCGKFSVSFCLSKISNLDGKIFSNRRERILGDIFWGQGGRVFQQQHATKVRGAAKPLPSQ